MGEDQGEQIQNENTKPIDRIEEARQLAERIEASNREAKALLEEKRRQEAEALLGGVTNAGQPKEEKPKELTDHEYRLEVERRIRSGEFDKLKEI